MWMKLMMQMLLKFDHANDIDYLDDVHFHPCPSHQLDL